VSEKSEIGAASWAYNLGRPSIFLKLETQTSGHSDRKNNKQETAAMKKCHIEAHLKVGQYTTDSIK